MRKQVDPHWQRRRQSHLQSVQEEDDWSEQVLKLPEPTLHTLLTHSASSSSLMTKTNYPRTSTSVKGTSNNYYQTRPTNASNPNKLTSKIHPTKGQPVFVYEIPFENVYGTVDDETAAIWQHDNITMRQMRRLDFLTKI